MGISMNTSPQYAMGISMNREVSHITRVVLTPDGKLREPGMAIVSKKEYETLVLDQDTNEDVAFTRRGVPLIAQKSFEFQNREIFQYVIEGKKAKIVTKKTIDGERSFIENAASIKTGDAFSGTLKFTIDEDEAIYGLGQQEQGTYNYRGVKEYLYQNNMQIPMPVFLSSKGYAILLDADCLMAYEEADNMITLNFDAVDQMSYYVITGDGFDALIAGIRELTGTAVMLPRWAFGYIQSRERYITQEDILATREEFEKRDIPVSCMVLDWKSWAEGQWGNKFVDKERFPNLKEMTDKLHEKDIAFMISIWPNMNKGCDNNQEMMDAGKLLANLSTYDAFDPEARDLYWKQCERELFKSGADAWWCDSTEPFTPDWNGLEKRSEEERYELARENLTRYFDARKANNYALVHAKGIYEHQRASDNKKRVANLTRSGSLSIQQYGTILWSGDIMATWEVFRNQIAEGLSMCMSGIPYWTLDIGAFFAGSTQGFRRFCGVEEGEAPWFWHGLFEKGTDDFGYRELYTRWLQFGTFLPVMRSHGTDTYREPWYFGEPGTEYYDTIVDYIKLRYEMLPYTYSLAHKVEADDYTILRSLMFDFNKDINVREISGEFMYGPSYLVCPVTRAMEYGPENSKLDGKTTWKVYLPEGACWYHQKTKEVLNGGQNLEVEAPINWQPVFIKAGSILPLSKKCMKDGTADTIEVYEGQDGSFDYYLDNGVDYQYEEGNYALIPIRYEEKQKCVMLNDVEGNYSYPQEFDVKFFRLDGMVLVKHICYEGKGMRIDFHEINE